MQLPSSNEIYFELSSPKNSELIKDKEFLTYCLWCSTINNDLVLCKKLVSMGAIIHNSVGSPLIYSIIKKRKDIEKYFREKLAEDMSGVV